MEGAPAHELRHAFGAQQTVFQFKLAGAAQGLAQLGMDADQREQPLVLPRLLDEVARAALDGFDGQVDVAPGGHDDHRQARIELLNARQQVEALLAGGGVARVVEVDEQHVVVALAQRLQQQLRRAHAVHIDALRSEQQLDGLEDVRLIVGNQNPDWLLLTGMVCLHNAGLGVGDRDAVVLEHRAGGAPHFNARLLVAVSAVTSADSAMARSCSAASVC
jgi:hypothetical protein